MRKLHFLFVFLVCSVTSFGQQITRIHLDTSTVVQRISKEVIRVTSPVFSQEGSVLRADSADFNQVQNTFDAFGHIVINQPNGTVIYADLLNYNGNTRIAILTNNVRMIDSQGAVLTTNLLTYNTATRIGNYVNGGKIVNKGDVLTSTNGYYFDSTRDAYFRYNVVVTTKDAVMKADTMRYNSGTRIAYFYGPTHIYSKQDTLYTEWGEYNTVTRQAHGTRNNLYQQGTKFLKGDTIFYDDIKGFGQANRNVVFTDTGAQKIMLFGQQGVYSRLDTSATITRNPYVIFLAQDSAKVDSVYMTADTIISRLIQRRNFKLLNLSQLILDAASATDEVSDADRLAAVKRTKAALAKAVPPKPVVQQKKPKKKKKGDKSAEEVPLKVPGPDSLLSANNLESKEGITLKRPRTKTQLADSLRRDSTMRDSVKFSKDTTRTRIVMAYHHVKIFKSDLQSTADSLFYSYQDSIIRMYKHPVVWAQGSQMLADTLYMQLKNRKLDRLLLQRNGFITNTSRDSSNFNQVKGRTITGFFKDSRLQRMYVNGSAESIYFISDSTGYTGMNHSEGSVMRLTFENNEVSDLTELRPQNSTYTPYEKVKEKELKGFSWLPERRPKSKEEIIPTLKKKGTVPGKKPVPAVKPVTPVKISKPGTG